MVLEGDGVSNGGDGGGYNAAPVGWEGPGEAVFHPQIQAGPQSSCNFR